ncbi:MAG: hypothetical protein ACYTBJ_05315 [Planctomycetota bacterium]|jgi:hypothetical protein
MNSLELVRHLHDFGMIRKEAAVRVLRKRDKLIKAAMVDLTNEYFFEKQAILGFGGETKKYTTHANKATLQAMRGAPKGGILAGASARNIAPLLGLAGLVALGTTAAKVGLGTLSDLKTKKQLGTSYKGLFKEYPEFKENKGQVTKYFQMMSKYAPSLATNPIIAGTWIKTVMNMNVVDPKNIHTLIEAQKDWEGIRAMKSPLIGFTQEFPRAGDIFSKALITGAAD